MTWVVRYLAYPYGLLLLAALVPLACFAVLAALARRRSWLVLGWAPAMEALSSRSPGRLWLAGALAAVGLLLAGLAAAGPQWGRERLNGTSAVRDLVIVQDVSRSMLAESPSRQVRAQRVLADLAQTLKDRGGHRVALVVAAARARVALPLTTDYDMFLESVMLQDAANLPPEMRPGKDGPASGTRLGEGIQQAIAVHQQHFRGSQVILLVSDGDDPLDDGEWKEGITAARRAGIAVYTVGVGDPTRSSKIRLGEHVLTHDGKPVESAVREDVLKEIAERTNGAFFPVWTERPAPGSLFQAMLEAASAAPREAPTLENPRPRFRWFMAGAAICLMASMLISQRRSPRQRSEPTESTAGSATRSARAGAAVLIAVCITAAAPLGLAETDDHQRQASEAFAKKDYETALYHFERAEELSADPGQVAFNKGVTLARLTRWREAELCFLRSLQDQDAPQQRRSLALFNLGTSLIQRGVESKDTDALRQAIDAFEFCRKEATVPSVRQDAEYNGELARLLWLKVRAEAPKDESKSPESNSDIAANRPNRPFRSRGDEFGRDRIGPDDPDGDGAGQLRLGDPAAGANHTKMPGAGSVKTLADSDQLQLLDSRDARDLLARAIQRIERDARAAAAQGQTEIRGVKEW
jgi:Ca-activated chloride channel homolog